MSFKNKTVMILGGNSGIGLAAARKFHELDANLVIIGRDNKTLDEAREELSGCQAIKADISDVDAMVPAVTEAKQKFGSVDVLFVNAGVGGFAMVDDVTPEMWDTVHNVNLRGCFFAIQKVIPALNDGGAIVITGSIGATAAIPGNVMYATAKAGLRAMARIMAKELLPRGIRVNMVSPGPTETPLLYRNPGMTEEDIDALKKMMIKDIPMGRMGEAEEIANAVVFLASDEASFITGQDLTVDGGCLEL